MEPAATDPIGWVPSPPVPAIGEQAKRSTNEDVDHVNIVTHHAHVRAQNGDNFMDFANTKYDVETTRAASLPSGNLFFPSCHIRSDCT